jgi:hypothetical protein
MKTVLTFFFFTLVNCMAYAQCSVTLTYTPASCDTCCDGCVTASVDTDCAPAALSWTPTDPSFPFVCSACANATYIVTMIDDCGCTAMDTVTIVQTTGIISIPDANGLLIYPNPVRDFMTVKFTTANIEKIQFQIISPVGQTVQSGYIGAGKTEYIIPLENIGAGHYTVHFIGEKGDYLYSTPLIIE